MIRGTVKELAGKVSVNGQVLGQPELSFLTRLGRGQFAKPVGQVKPPGKGKPATIWEINSNPRFKVMAVEVDETAPEIVAGTSDTAETVSASDGEAVAS